MQSSCVTLNAAGPVVCPLILTKKSLSTLSCSDQWLLFELSLLARLLLFKAACRRGLWVIGCQSRDETAMLVFKSNGKISPKFYITIASNFQRNFFAIVQYTNMTTVTSHQSREYKKWLSRLCYATKPPTNACVCYGELEAFPSGNKRLWKLFLTMAMSFV